MSEAPDEADLWIGAPAWPRSWQKQSGARGAPWEGVALEEFQIAGLRCHHQEFFGLRFRVPRRDPLAILVASYLGSHLPGTGNPEDATPLEEVVRVRDRLSEIGLVLDPTYYARFAEAYIPVSAESAWRYAVHRRFSLLHRREIGDLGTERTA